MSGQRVTGVVVGGEEVFAKEVQLLKKTCVGAKIPVFLRFGAKNMRW